MLKVIVFLAGIGYLVKLLIKHYATLSSKNLENISNFEGSGLTLIASKKCSLALSRLEKLNQV